MKEDSNTKEEIFEEVEKQQTSENITQHEDNALV